MENLRTNEFNDYVVIGLGKFGKSLAMNLAEEGKKVLAVDNNAQNIEEVQEFVTHAVVADVTKKDVLHSLGVQNFDCAMICIGSDLTSSMLATLIVKELGVPYIIAKAQNEQHKDLLEKVGADLVLFPEVYMSKKLASTLSDPFSNDIISITDNYKIVETRCPQSWADKTIIDVNVRKKYGINIVVIKRDGETIEPMPETVMEKGDTLIVSGSPKNIETVVNKVNDLIDLKDILNEATTEE